MRENLPVTHRAYDFPADATLMSTTDPLSHIVGGAKHRRVGEFEATDESPGGRGGGVSVIVRWPNCVLARLTKP